MGGGSGSGSGARYGDAKIAPLDSRSFDNECGGNSGMRRSRSARDMASPEKVEPPPPPPLGFQNLGNTCYANSTLQCLLSTALPHALLDPGAAVIFRRYSSNPNLLAMERSGSDLDDDEEDDKDLVCHEDLARRAEEKKQREEMRERQRRRERERNEMHKTCRWLTKELTEITREYTATPPPPPPPPKDDGGFFSFFSSPPPPPRAHTIDPGAVTRNPQRLCKTMRPYQQEDAHEFLRALLSTLVMNGQNRQLSSLFDGLLESAVSCTTCHHSSLTRDRYMDLSLDISHNHVTDLPSALREFTKTEVLDGDNMVTCNGDCNGQKRTATKGLRLATAPSILVCHFKRFAYNRYGNLVRLDDKIDFPLTLSIGEFMSKANRSTPPPYELVGVLVHVGQSCNRGHYLAYVKSGADWYKADDSVVKKVPIKKVLEQRAYMLVYEVAGMRAKNGFRSYRKYHNNRAKDMASCPDFQGDERGHNPKGNIRGSSAPTIRSMGAASPPPPPMHVSNGDTLKDDEVLIRIGGPRPQSRCKSFDDVSGSFASICALFKPLCGDNLCGTTEIDLCGNAETIDDSFSPPAPTSRRATTPRHFTSDLEPNRSWSNRSGCGSPPGMQRQGSGTSQRDAPPDGHHDDDGMDMATEQSPSNRSASTPRHAGAAALPSASQGALKPIKLERSTSSSTLHEKEREAARAYRAASGLSSPDQNGISKKLVGKDSSEDEQHGKHRRALSEAGVSCNKSAHGPSIWAKRRHGFDRSKSAGAKRSGSRGRFPPRPQKGRRSNTVDAGDNVKAKGYSRKGRRSSMTDMEDTKKHGSLSPPGSP